MKSSKFITNKTILIFCAFFTLYSVAFSTLLGSTYPTSDTFYDLLLPQISGHAMASGLSPSIDFYSPFGIIYHKLNQLSYSLILEFSAYLQIFDINMINSIIICLFITSFFILFRLVVKLPVFILIFITSISLQMRFISNLTNFIDPTRVSWSGIYNNQMWGLILLQICFIFAIDKYIKCKKLTNEKLKLLSYILGTTSFITFNFKINFFPASILISTSLLCRLKPKQSLEYMTTIALVIIILNFGASIIFNYSYLAYFLELKAALAVKQSFEYDLLNQSTRCFPVILTYITAMFIIRYGYPVIRDNNHLSFMQIISLLKTKGLIHNLKQKGLLKDIFFDLCFVLSVVLILAGDSTCPNGYMHIITILLLYTVINTNNTCVTSAPHILSCIIIIINIIGLSFLTYAKFNAVIINNTSSKVTMLNSDTTGYKFRIESYRGLENLLTKLNDKDQQHMINLSYKYNPFNMSWHIPFHNAEYISMINSSLKSIKKFNTQNSNKIYMLGFANPLPMLMNLKYPKYNHHWLDIFITFSPNNMKAFDNIFSSSNLVYMPFFTIDNLVNPAAQTFINCYFYKWNFTNKKFALVNVDGYGMTFNKKESNYFPEITLPPETEINKSCNKLEKDMLEAYHAKKSRLKKTNMLDLARH